VRRPTSGESVPLTDGSSEGLIAMRVATRISRCRSNMVPRACNRYRAFHRILLEICHLRLGSDWAGQVPEVVGSEEGGDLFDLAAAQREHVDAVREGSCLLVPGVARGRQVARSRCGFEALDG
jgi:hypothetical protein